jgi:hypothetical protein
MLTKLLIAFGLMAACVVLHAIGLTLALSRTRRALSRAVLPYRKEVALLIMLAVWTVVMHLAEISLWAFHYAWVHAMPDLDSALYFSAVTYTTVGYGDLVLPAEWRLIGGVEALTGILMCGWSTGFFFAICIELFHRRARAEGSLP